MKLLLAVWSTIQTFAMVFSSRRNWCSDKKIPVTDEGALDLEAYKKLFTSRTKMVAVAHASNVMGTINPIKEMTAIAHSHGVPILVDGAQAAPICQLMCKI